VREDLEFMRTTAAQLLVAHERLVPLVAHDRASLGGMLIANGIAVLLCTLWGFLAGERWLWNALAWAGATAFGCAIGVHYVVGYESPFHLAPAFAGLGIWTLALLLTRGWLAPGRDAPVEVPER
jgi:dihydroorotate dehydrogenase